MTWHSRAAGSCRPSRSRQAATGAHSQELRPAAVDAASLDDFQLPPKTVFDRAMPRYPNVWFYVEASLVDSQAAAMRLVAEQVRAAMRVRESYGSVLQSGGGGLRGDD